MEKLDNRWTIRSVIAKKTVEAAECINDMEEKYYYCYEAFRSDSNVKNLLKLFEDKDIAEKYGRDAKTLLSSKGIDKGNALKSIYKEKECNEIREYTYNFLLFFTGDITSVKNKCKNTSNSLGWSGCFIKQGIELFLMYLYSGENMEKEKALGEIGGYFGRSEGMEEMQFFQLFGKWKQYYPMEMTEKAKFLEWAEKNIRKRVDAIVSGQHRRKYGAVAMLLGAMSEVKESWGEKGIKQRLRQEYQKNIPDIRLFKEN